MANVVISISTPHVSDDETKWAPIRVIQFKKEEEKTLSLEATKLGYVPDAESQPEDMIAFVLTHLIARAEAAQ